MAFVIFTQSLFPAVILALCNLILAESLKSELPKHVAGTDVAAIIKAGATGFRDQMGTAEVSGVLVTYANSLNRIFYLVAAFASASAIFIWGIGWQDLRKKKPVEDASIHRESDTVMGWITKTETGGNHLNTVNVR